MIQQMLTIWSLAPLPFLNSAWTSGSSRFMYCWCLAWRILNITLLACAAPAKSLQSCLTLCNSIDSSPPGTSVHGIFQARVLEWGAIDCVDHNKLWKILKEMAIPDHLTCLLRNLYAGQEVTVRTGHGTTDWFQIGTGICQGCILSLCLFNLYAEYIMCNSGLDEAQGQIKIARRNINNLR